MYYTIYVCPTAKRYIHMYLTQCTKTQPLSRRLDWALLTLEGKL